MKKFILPTITTIVLLASSCQEDKQYTIDKTDNIIIPTEDEMLERLSEPTVVIG